MNPTAVLKILILGGTHFLGLHLTEEAQKKGHEVTLFNRGIQNPDLFPTVEQLRGDRDGHLEALLGRKWDAVIDTSGHLPRIVAQSAQLLANATDHYTFISTIGVYENFHQMNIDESYPIAKLKDPQSEEITEKTYGALKGLCEAAVQHYFPHKACIIRPGVIVGPHDPTDRFTYWVRRLAEGGEVLAVANCSIQLIDVRDLAQWIIQMVENRKTGVYNAVGAPFSFEKLFHSARATWVSESFLLEKGVQDWIELPLWLSSERKMPGFFHINSQKAVQSGLTFRPLEETINATLQWDKTREVGQHHTGLTRSKEQELLREWRHKGP